MATPSYTNADLRRFERKPLGVTIEREPYVNNDPDIDELLRQAYSTLGRASRLSEETGAPGISTLDERAQALQPVGRRGSLRGLTEAIATPAPWLGGAALGATVVPGAQPAAPILGALSTLSAAPDVLRRIISPEEDESRGLAAAEGGLYALGAKPLLRGAKTAARYFKPVEIVEEAAEAAGAAAHNRYMARQLDELGHSKSQVQKLTGLGPRTPRSVSTAQPISRNTTPISDIMSGEEMAFTRSGAKSPSIRGLMEALEGPAEGISAAEAEAVGLPGSFARFVREPGWQDPRIATANVRRAARPSRARGVADDMGFEVVDDLGVNASGESAASLEAISRLKGMTSRGEQFVVRRGGTTRPLVGPDAVDYSPRPGEEFGIMQGGQFRLLSRGSR